MEDITIVLYASPDHLNTISLLAKFISKHHPYISIIIISTAAPSAAAAVTSVPSITYHHLPTAALPANNQTTNPVELFFEIPRLNNPNLHKALLEISQKSRIKAFIIDFFCYTAFEVSTSLNIPTYFDFSTGAFGLCAMLYFPAIHDAVPGNFVDLNEFIHIPGCPPVHSSDFPEGLFYRESKTYKHFLESAKTMAKSRGIIVNAFDAISVRAKEALSNGLCVPNAPTPPIYFLGPLIEEKTSQNDGVKHDCMQWLNSQPRKSVIFLCFGRRGLFSGKQLKEMAKGLENSGHRFLWSVRNPPGKRMLAPTHDEPDLDALLPEGFLERTKDRGFVIKSWAPQREILSHDSVAGFVTHCGWSSTMEAVSCGVPMIAWPIYAEQKMNRVFMVEEMQVAVPLAEAADGLVAAAELEERVSELMDSDIGLDVRNRVAEMKISAELAVSENGSSVVALEKFIESVTEN